MKQPGGQSHSLSNLDEACLLVFHILGCGEKGVVHKSCHLGPFSIWNSQMGQFIPREEMGVKGSFP